MALNNHLRLLLISFYLIATVNIAFSKRHLSPAPQPGSSAFTPAPAPKRHKQRATVPSLAPSNQISFPPSSSIAHPPKSAAAPSIATHVSSKISSADNKIVHLQLQNFCALTDHPDLCYTTNFPTLKGEKAINIEKVLESNMKNTNDYAKLGLTLTNKIATQPGTPKELLSALHECKSSYKDVLFNLEKASSASAEHDIGTVQTMLSAVITDLGDCQDELKEVPEESNIAEFAKKLTNMTSNSLAIIERLTAA